MMGTGYGYLPGPKHSITKKYAWFPKKTSSNKWIWRDYYYYIETYYMDGEKFILNEKEYLFWTIKNSVKTSTLPSGKIRIII